MGFDCMIGAYKLYDPSIEDDATNGLRKNMEREWTTCLAIQSLIRACEMGCRSFILKAVEDTWVRSLRYPDSLYTRVAPRDLLDLLATYSDGLESSDVVGMFSTMRFWWSEGPRFPSFINIFNDAQNKATCASLPINYYCLATMDTSALLSTKSFPNDRPYWDGLVPSDHTWTAWKLKFSPLHSAMERESRAFSQHGDSFGSPNLEMDAH